LSKVKNKSLLVITIGLIALLVSYFFYLSNNKKAENDSLDLNVPKVAPEIKENTEYKSSANNTFDPKKEHNNDPIHLSNLGTSEQNQTNTKTDISRLSPEDVKAKDWFGLYNSPNVQFNSEGYPFIILDGDVLAIKSPPERGTFIELEFTPELTLSGDVVLSYEDTNRKALGVKLHSDDSIKRIIHLDYDEHGRITSGIITSGKEHFAYNISILENGSLEIIATELEQIFPDDEGLLPEDESSTDTNSSRNEKEHLNSSQNEESGDALETVGAPPVPPESVAPLNQTFFLHSKPGAKHTIYLDFDGHITSGTRWNTNYNDGETITTPAYNFEGTPSTFTNAELTRIQWMWFRASEHFMPFDVNVTTEEPSIEALSKTTDGLDTEWGIRVVIGGSSHDWLGLSAGGIATLNSFNATTDLPTFVFPAQLGGGHEKYTADCISHEVGHTLGSHHHGRSSPSETYYQGHGSGSTGWAPIMGSSYFKNLAHWSKAEYPNPSRPNQDDLHIITNNNGFSYRTDDHGNNQLSATLLNFNPKLSV